MRILKVLWLVLLFVSCRVSAQDGFVPYYRIFGEGKPVLIINGGPGMNSDGFANLAGLLADMGYQTIIFDQRGTGQTQLDTLSAQTVTMDLMVEDMERLREELGFETWTVMGHSFGGLLACHYFSTYSNRVDKLIFSSSGGVNLDFIRYVGQRIDERLTPLQRDSLNYYRNKMTEGDTSAFTRKQRARFLAGAYVVDEQFAEIIAERLSTVNLALNALVFQDLRRINFNYTGKFLAAQTPVLILQGDDDVISVETAEEIRNSFGNARLVVLEHCGHYGWLDNPKVYFEALEQFLKQ